MSNIELLHSYQYVKHKNIKINQQNNVIRTDNNKSIINLTNIPSNKELYSIKIERIAKKQSLKCYKNNLFNDLINDKNIKIIVIINYTKLFNYVNNNIFIPNKNELFKLIKRNYNQSHYSYLLDTFNFYNKIINTKNKLTYHKTFKELVTKLDSDEFTFTYIPSYIKKISDLYFDFNDELIFSKKMIYKKEISTKLRGGILLSDFDFDRKLFFKSMNWSKNNLIFYENYNKCQTWINSFDNISFYVIKNKDNLSKVKNFKKYTILLIDLSFYVEYKSKLQNDNINDKNDILFELISNSNYERILYDNCELTIKSNKYNSYKHLKSKSKWFLSEKTNLLKNNDLIKIYNFTFGLNVSNSNVNILNKLLVRYKNESSYNIIKIDVKLNQYEKKFHDKFYKKITDFDLDLFLSLTTNMTKSRFITKPNIKKKFNFNLDNKIDNTCAICLKKLSIDNLAFIDKCHHIFCYTCIYKSVSGFNSCPCCRENVELSNIYRIVNKEINLEYQISSKIEYIYREIEKFNHIIIISKYNQTITTLKNITSDLLLNKKIDLLLINNLEKLTKKKYEGNCLVICMEVLDDSKEDKYFKDVILNLFNQNKIIILNSIFS